MYEIESFHHIVVTNATCQGHHIKKKLWVNTENRKYNYLWLLLDSHFSAWLKLNPNKLKIIEKISQQPETFS